MPQLNHAADSPLRALALITQHCNSGVCRTHADGMEVFLPGAPPETAVLLPRICQPPHRAVLSGTRNRHRGSAASALTTSSLTVTCGFRSPAA